MIVKNVYSPDVYRKIMYADQKKKDDIIMANNMLGIFPPSEVNMTTADWIETISDQKLWDACQKSIEDALERFTHKGIALKVQEYLFTVLLADPENAYTKMNEGYCGDGGIPGYVQGTRSDTI